MDRVDLKEHLESFRALPKEEYSLLERACESGLALSPYAVVGRGREVIEGDKELEEFFGNLSESFHVFEKLTKSRKRLGGLLEKNRAENYRSYFDTGETLGKACSYVDVLGVLASCAGILAYSVAEALGAPSFGVAGGVWAVTSIAYFLGVAVGAVVGEVDEYFGPSALVVCSAAYVKDKQLKRAVLQRRVRKGEKKLKREVIGKRYGLKAYDLEWYEKIEKDLLAGLLSCDQKFPARFMEMERRLLPEDRLRMYKKLEATVQKRIGQTDYTQEFGKVREVYDIAGLARKAGIGAAQRTVRGKMRESIQGLGKKEQERIIQIQKEKEEKMKRVAEEAEEKMKRVAEEAEEKKRKEHEFREEETRKRKEFLRSLN